MIQMPNCTCEDMCSIGDGKDRYKIYRTLHIILWYALPSRGYPNINYLLQMNKWYIILLYIYIYTPILYSIHTYTQHFTASGYRICFLSSANIHGGIIRLHQRHVECIRKRISACISISDTIHEHPGLTGLSRGVYIIII